MEGGECTQPMRYLHVLRRVPSELSPVSTSHSSVLVLLHQFLEHLNQLLLHLNRPIGTAQHFAACSPRWVSFRHAIGASFLGRRTNALQKCPSKRPDQCSSTPLPFLIHTAPGFREYHACVLQWCASNSACRSKPQECPDFTGRTGCQLLVF